jgi:hypothetical protein
LSHRLSEVLSAQALEQTTQQVITVGIDKTVAAFSEQLADCVR